MAKQLLISIITSYDMDRLRDIFELVDSIKAQTYPNTETIFVTERSKELFDLSRDTQLRRLLSKQR